jgi:hypothetical protein
MAGWTVSLIGTRVTAQVYLSVSLPAELQGQPYWSVGVQMRYARLWSQKDGC